MDLHTLFADDLVEDIHCAAEDIDDDFFYTAEALDVQTAQVAVGSITMAIERFEETAIAVESIDDGLKNALLAVAMENAMGELATFEGFSGAEVVVALEEEKGGFFSTLKRMALALIEGIKRLWNNILNWLTKHLSKIGFLRKWALGLQAKAAKAKAMPKEQTIKLSKQQAMDFRDTGKDKPDEDYMSGNLDRFTNETAYYFTNTGSLKATEAFLDKADESFKVDIFTRIRNGEGNAVLNNFFQTAVAFTRDMAKAYKLKAASPEQIKKWGGKNTALGKMGFVSEVEMPGRFTLYTANVMQLSLTSGGKMQIPMLANLRVVQLPLADGEYSCKALVSSEVTKMAKSVVDLCDELILSKDFLRRAQSVADKVSARISKLIKDFDGVDNNNFIFRALFRAFMKMATTSSANSAIAHQFIKVASDVAMSSYKFARTCYQNLDGEKAPLEESGPSGQLALPSPA